ncbi:hypothetical protein I5677_16070 [Mobilitalea sibirica]|uniref:Uncharacterized protein n=1 Tax=Mobilitalea sibirica TaxID=1462919 RepID=A0A8J7H4K2_9FIRM|nr:DUF6715 family protein [Mobilitalea sibirica]MBH1942418.1 hypothetical protein [Mobilitalea sibirica]
MGKAKIRTATTIITMTIVAGIIVFVYFYWSNRTDPLKEASFEEITEVEKLLNKDLTLFYPETPREVVKLYSAMFKELYSDIKDDETEALALKIRELYDKELLALNPKEEYLNNLYSEIASAKKAHRKISHYYLINKEEEAKTIKDGKEYATVSVSYTIQEKGKISETRKFILRRSDEGEWKILGWKKE